MSRPCKVEWWGTGGVVCTTPRVPKTRGRHIHAHTPMWFHPCLHIPAQRHAGGVTGGGGGASSATAASAAQLSAITATAAAWLHGQLVRLGCGLLQPLEQQQLELDGSSSSGGGGGGGNGQPAAAAAAAAAVAGLVRLRLALLRFLAGHLVLGPRVAEVDRCVYVYVPVYMYGGGRGVA